MNKLLHIIVVAKIVILCVYIIRNLPFFDECLVLVSMDNFANMSCPITRVLLFVYVYFPSGYVVDVLGQTEIGSLSSVPQWTYINTNQLAPDIPSLYQSTAEDTIDDEKSSKMLH